MCSALIIWQTRRLHAFHFNYWFCQIKGTIFPQYFQSAIQITKGGRSPLIVKVFTKFWILHSTYWFCQRHDKSLPQSVVRSAVPITKAGKSPLNMFFAIPNSEFLILHHYFARRHFSSSRHYPRVTEMRGSHSSTVSQLIPLLWPLDGTVVPSQTGSVASQRFPFAPPSTKSAQLQTQPSQSVHRMWVKYDAFCYESLRTAHTRFPGLLNI